MSGVIASEPAGLAVGRLLVTFDDTGGQINNKVAALGRVNIATSGFCWRYAFDFSTRLGLSKLLGILVTLDQGSAINPRIPGIPGIPGIRTGIWN